MPEARFEHIRLKSGFEAVKTSGRRESSAFFTLLYLKSGTDTVRQFGVICSRRFDVRAVRRNRARRLIREAMRLIGPGKLVPSALVVIPRRAILKVHTQKVQEALLHAFKHADLLVQNGPSASTEAVLPPS